MLLKAAEKQTESVADTAAVPLVNLVKGLKHKNTYRQSPLALAIIHNNTSIVHLPTKHGADMQEVWVRLNRK